MHRRGDRGQPLVLTFPIQTTKANKQGHIFFVRTYLQIQSTTKLNEKLTRRYTQELNTYARKNWGLKMGESVESDIFSGNYGTTFVNGILYHKQLILYSHQTVWLPTLVAITTQHGGAEAYMCYMN